MFEPIQVKFATETWSIEKLLKLFEQKRLNLSPRYQRNDIWSTARQGRLIETVQAGYPMPNFFVRLRSNEKFEMVDGQQRARTLLAYWSGSLADLSKLTLSPKVKSDPGCQPTLRSFLEYSLTVSVLDQSLSDKDVENFYVLVNSSGMRLNKPELRKAAFHDTRFLRLANEIASHPYFSDLALFTAASEERMNDVEFVSELLAFIDAGFTDKKEEVERLYKDDVSEAAAALLREKALATLERIASLNNDVPLQDTRYRQKADFYTLFAFLSNNKNLHLEMLKYCYQILLRLAPHIRPSQDRCEPLFNYALNCVSQSHLKTAREARNSLLEELFLNTADIPNKTQAEIAKYFGLGDDGFTKKWGSLLFKLEVLEH